MNGYTRVSRLKAALGAQVVSLPGSEVDPRLLKIIEEVSREWDEMTGGMHLYSLTATRYFEQHANAIERDVLWVGPVVDLSAVAYDSAGNYGYATTLVANTDYWLEPANRLGTEPGWWLRTVPGGALSSWPTARRSIRITGRWGHSHQVADTGQTVQNNPLTSGGTTLTLTRGHDIEPGETLVIESEQIAVTASSVVSDAVNLTVTRGVNGTTAAQHAQGTAIYRRVYPDDIEGPLITRCRSKWHAEFGGGDPGNDIQWTGAGKYELFPAWMRTLRRYRLPEVA